MERKEMLSRVLLYGALGDALGYPIEFYPEYQIDEYLTEMNFNRLLQGEYLVSDDTQMALFTFEGILINDEDPIPSIYKCYLDWLDTQTLRNDGPNVSKLKHIDVLRHQRAPGITCLNALQSGTMGTYKTILNDSKGCGGMMRLAPLAVYYAYTDKASHTISDLAAQSSAITHSHKMSHISSYHFAGILVSLIRNQKDLKETILETLEETLNYFNQSQYVNEYKSLIEKTIALSEVLEDDRSSTHDLGEGWIAEESLAIALYSVLKYKDPKQALYTSINHRGDCDSTGILAGNILAVLYPHDISFDEYFEKIDVYELIEDLLQKFSIQ